MIINHTNKITIYTDGACSDNPGPGGWAAVFNEANECTTISDCDTSTTNNRMELMAVIKSYERIINEYDSNYIFELYTDSAYVANAIRCGWLYKWQKNGWKTSKGDMVKNKDLWETFIELNNNIKDLGIRVLTIKIKGHSGNVFNELVDKLAKEQSIKAKKELTNNEKK